MALLRLYVFETLLPRIYGKTWPLLVDDTQRRNFTNHHVAAMLKLTMVASQINPIMGLIFGNLTLQSPMSKGSSVTLGDIMVVGVQIFVGMYVFELFYRSRVSYISTLHHIGAIVIAESAVTVGIDYVHQKSATAQFLICFVWGRSSTMSDAKLTAKVCSTWSQSFGLISLSFFIECIRKGTISSLGCFERPSFANCWGLPPRLFWSCGFSGPCGKSGIWRLRSSPRHCMCCSLSRSFGGHGYSGLSQRRRLDCIENR
jgi:hypothetical protein